MRDSITYTNTHEMIFNSNDLYEGQLVKHAAANVVSITDTVTCALIIAKRTAVCQSQIFEGKKLLRNNTVSYKIEINSKKVYCFLWNPI